MTIETAILNLTEALDPEHQGECWPDPIKWDGRPIREQARDLLSIVPVREEHHADSPGTRRVDYAAQALRSALAGAG